MVSTRSMRSRGNENGKQTGEVVDSFPTRKSAVSHAEGQAAEGTEEAKKPSQKILRESNAAEINSGVPVAETEPFRRSTRQRKPAVIKEEPDAAEEAAVPELDALQNAASVPLPGDGAAQEAKTRSPTKKTTTQTGAHSPGSKSKARQRPAASTVSWKWAILILAVAVGTALAIHYRHAWEPPLIKAFQHAEGVLKTQAKEAEAYIRGPLLLKAKAWQGIVHDEAHKQREKLAEVTLRLRYGAQTLWRHVQQAVMPEGKAGKVKGCAAQLDADALEAIMSSSAGFEGLRSSLHDVWLGHKEDPHKGAGVLLVGGSSSANSAAALAVEKALPSPCRSCLLDFKAGQLSHGRADAPGAVQKQLGSFLKRCPQGVVIVENVHKLHPRLLPIFINALSEHGHFEVDGQSVPSWGALYVATLLDNDGKALAETGEDTFKREAKKALTEQLLAHPSAEQVPGYRAHTEAFRRRLEHVAPLQL